MGTYAECIGRYELSLPEAVDFAVTAPEALLKESPHLIRFTDGEEAPHSVLSYEGVFRITSQVPQSRFDKRVWGYEYGIGKRIKLHGLMPYRSVKLDGREGIATSATITRDDDSTDYGYLATVQGNPNASIDTPSLLLLVERNAKYAKGNPPVTAAELQQIAEGIAASVKRRPVQ